MPTTLYDVFFDNKRLRSTQTAHARFTWRVGPGLGSRTGAANRLSPLDWAPMLYSKVVSSAAKARKSEPENCKSTTPPHAVRSLEANRIEGLTKHRECVKM